MVSRVFRLRSNGRRQAAKDPGDEEGERGIPN
jgi:hypothetical protein